MDSRKATGEPDPRLIHTGYGQYSAGNRMSTRLRVFAWIVVAVALAIWVVAIWFVMFHTGRCRHFASSGLLANLHAAEVSAETQPGMLRPWR
jgi:type VI protein secretion system component VasF